MSKNKKTQFAVGQIAHLPVDELRFEVKILSIKRSYGRQRYLVQPVKGSGEQMVEKLEAKDQNQNGEVR